MAYIFLFVFTIDIFFYKTCFFIYKAIQWWPEKYGIGRWPLDSSVYFKYSKSMGQRNWAVKTDQFQLIMDLMKNYLYY